MFVFGFFLLPIIQIIEDPFNKFNKKKHNCNRFLLVRHFTGPTEAQVPLLLHGSVNITG